LYHINFHLILQAGATFRTFELAPYSRPVSLSAQIKKAGRLAGQFPASYVHW
jgi:hypothetical protein